MLKRFLALITCLLRGHRARDLDGHPFMTIPGRNINVYLCDRCGGVYWEGEWDGYNAFILCCLRVQVIVAILS